MRNLWIAMVLLLTSLPGILTGSLAAESRQLPGKFVGADLVTDDAMKAQRFFEDWLGWEFRNHEDMSLILHDGQLLGAIRQRSRPEGSAVRPRWVSYIAVNDVDAVAQRVTASGGTVLLTKQSDSALGEFVVLADPEGAMFGIIRRADGDPDDYLVAPGEWIWLQLFTRDTENAALFYNSVGGYQAVSAEGEVAGRQLLVKDDFARASMVKIPDAQVDAKAAWLPFVRVEDIDKAMVKVEEFGGTVLIAPDASKVEGKAAIIADPSGAALGVLEWHAEPETTEVAP